MVRRARSHGNDAAHEVDRIVFNRIVSQRAVSSGAPTSANRPGNWVSSATCSRPRRVPRLSWSPSPLGSRRGVGPVLRHPREPWSL
jgi:hypothetical protein